MRDPGNEVGDEAERKDGRPGNGERGTGNGERGTGNVNTRAGCGSPCRSHKKSVVERGRHDSELPGLG